MPARTRPESPDYDHRTREELYDLAQSRDVEGRSDMSKQELAEALRLADTGPDAVTLLTEQHDEIRRLFAEYRDLSPAPSKRKQDLATAIVTILVKHAKIEEQVFYPAVASELVDEADEVHESLEEHHAAELLLDEIDGMDPAAERFDAKMTVLMEMVTHHLEEEEQQMFPRVLSGLPEERRRELGGAMTAVWRVAPTRPHPAAPSTPPANLVTAIPLTVIDLTVGTLRRLGRLVKGR